jgi:hypothetical protein
MLQSVTSLKLLKNVKYVKLLEKKKSKTPKDTEVRLCNAIDKSELSSHILG